MLTNVNIYAIHFSDSENLQTEIEFVSYVMSKNTDSFG